MRAFLQKHEVWVFLCLIVVAQTIFVMLVANEFVPERNYRLGRFYLLAGLLSVILLLSRGISGILEVLRPLFNFNVPWFWFPLALLWAPSLALIYVIGEGIVTGQGFSFSELDWSRMSKLGVIRSVLIASFVGEIVWVSYAIMRLSKRYSAFLSSQIVGIFWSFWWLPMAIFNVGIVQNVPIYAVFISIMAVAANCCFFYKNSGSALVVFMMQAMFNSCLLIFPVIPNNGGVMAYTAFSILYWVTALLMFNLFGPKPLFKKVVSLEGDAKQYGVPT